MIRKNKKPLPSIGLEQSIETKVDRVLDANKEKILLDDKLDKEKISESYHRLISNIIEKKESMYFVKEKNTKKEDLKNKKRRKKEKIENSKQEKQIKIKKIPPISQNEKEELPRFEDEIAKLSTEEADLIDNKLKEESSSELEEKDLPFKNIVESAKFKPIEDKNSMEFNKQIKKSGKKEKTNFLKNLKLKVQKIQMYQLMKNLFRQKLTELIQIIKLNSPKK